MASIQQQSQLNALSKKPEPTAAAPSYIDRLVDTFKGAADGAKSMLQDASIKNVLNNSTPDQFFDTLAGGAPDWKNAVTLIKQDKDLENATFQALKQDPTMLPGLTQFMGAGSGEKADPKEAEKFLNDPLNRRGLTEVMKKIVEDKDADGKAHDYTFADFKELYEAREDKEKSLKKLQEMGISPTSMMGGEDMLAMLGQFFKDPQGFMKQLPEMLGLHGAQGEAMGKLFNGLGMYTELVIGGKDGYRAFFERHPEVVSGTMQFGKDISGMTDQERAADAAAPKDQKQGPTLTPAQREKLDQTASADDIVGKGKRQSELTAKYNDAAANVNKPATVAYNQGAYGFPDRAAAAPSMQG